MSLFRTIFIVVSLVVWCTSLMAEEEANLFPLSKAFVPQGFTDRDQVEFVVSGSMPAANFRSTRIESKIDLREKVITVKQYFREYKGEALKIEIPFATTVTLRTPLEAGEYRIKDSFNGGEIGKLRVSRSVDKADSREGRFSIRNAEVKLAKSGSPVLVLSVLLPESASLKTQIIYSDDSIVVLPSLVTLKPTEEKTVPKIFTYNVKESLSGTYLFHVRYSVHKNWDSDKEIIQALTINRLIHFPLER